MFLSRNRVCFKFKIFIFINWYWKFRDYNRSIELRIHANMISQQGGQTPDAGHTLPTGPRALWKQIPLGPTLITMSVVLQCPTLWFTVDVGAISVVLHVSASAWRWVACSKLRLCSAKRQKTGPYEWWDENSPCQLILPSGTTPLFSPRTLASFLGWCSGLCSPYKAMVPPGFRGTRWPCRHGYWQHHRPGATRSAVPHGPTCCECGVRKC